MLFCCNLHRRSWHGLPRQPSQHIFDSRGRVIGRRRHRVNSWRRASPSSHSALVVNKPKTKGKGSVGRLLCVRCRKSLSMTTRPEILLGRLRLCPQEIQNFTLEDQFLGARVSSRDRSFFRFRVLLSGQFARPALVSNSRLRENPALTHCLRSIQR